MRAMIAVEQADGSVDVVVIEDVVGISTSMSSSGYSSAIRSVTTIEGVHGPSYRQHRPAWFPVAARKAVEG